MSAVLSIAKYTIIEQIRNRLYLIILFFGGVLLVTSLLLSAMAPGFRVRVIFDLGLVAIELFGLAAAIFGAVNLILQEVESKTIYLLLTRPLNRSTYIVGRFLGLVTAVFLVMIFMALLHLVLMMYRPFYFKIFLEQVDFWSVYPHLLMMSVAKMIITTGIALFFSLFATSAVSALVFTGSFWIAGHFGTELNLMIQQSLSGLSARLAYALSVLLPNFQYFNLKDTFPFTELPTVQELIWAWGYGLGYTAFFLFLSILLFMRKEF